MANNGTSHFKMQRLTAFALVVLVPWFLIALISHARDTHAEMMAWVSNPFAALPLALLIMVGFYHMSLGLSEVIDDYIHTPSIRGILHLLNKLAALLLGGICLWSIISISFIA